MEPKEVQEGPPPDGPQPLPPTGDQELPAPPASLQSAEGAPDTERAIREVIISEPVGKEKPNSEVRRLEESTGLLAEFFNGEVVVLDPQEL